MSLNIDELVAKVAGLHLSGDRPISLKTIEKAWEVVKSESPVEFSLEKGASSLKTDFKFDKVKYVYALADLVIQLYKLGAELGSKCLYSELYLSYCDKLTMPDSQEYIDLNIRDLFHKYDEKSTEAKKKDVIWYLSVMVKIFDLICPDVEILESFLRRDWYSWVPKGEFDELGLKQKINKLDLNIDTFKSGK